jgi:hypothetical protein
VIIKQTFSSNQEKEVYARVISSLVRGFKLHPLHFCLFSACFLLFSKKGQGIFTLAGLKPPGP